MKLSKDKKKEMLLDSFNVLKDNVAENADQLSVIIDMFLLMDKSVAIEMWEHIIDDNYTKFTSGDLDELTQGVVGKRCLIGEHISEIEMSNIIYDNDKIRNAIFKYSSDQCMSDDAIIYFISVKQLDKANTLLELISQNTNKNKTFSHIIENIIDRMNTQKIRGEIEITDETIELLTHWVDTVKDKNDKARITVNLMRIA